MLIAIQSFSQLDDRYGKAIKENILANTVNHLLLPGAGLEETQYYSERLGLTTITTQSHSRNTQPYRGGSQYTNMPTMMNNTSTGQTEGQSQRSLQTADELRTMKKGTMLFVNAASPATMLKTRAYFEDRTLARLADLPFELRPPSPSSPTIQVESLPEQEDQDVTEPELAAVRVGPSLPVLVQESEAAEGEEAEVLGMDEQEPRALEVEEEVPEPIGLEIEEAATRSQVYDTDLAPE
jgi:type IV secretion system protein VirD4